MRSRTQLFAAALAVAGLGFAVAQPPATPPTSPQTQPLGTVPAQPGQAGQPTDQQQQSFRARSVLGARVSVQNNQSVGTIEDMVFDGEGQIEYVIVADQGKFVTVPWQAVKFGMTAAAQGAAPAGQPLPYTATIAIPAEQFRQIPTFTATTYPQFYTPTYRTQVYQYYGLTPRDRRVLDRRSR